MKLSLSLVAAALMLLVALEASAPAQDVAFVNVNVVPMDRNGTLNNRTVIVRDGRIADIGPAGSTRGRRKRQEPRAAAVFGLIRGPLTEPTDAVCVISRRTDRQGGAYGHGRI